MEYCFWTPYVAQKVREAGMSCFLTSQGCGRHVAAPQVLLVPPMVRVYNFMAKYCRVALTFFSKWPEYWCFTLDILFD